MAKPGSARRGWPGGLALLLAAAFGAGAGPVGDREPPSAEWPALSVRVLSGTGRPGEVLAGRYLVRLLAGPKTVHEEEVVLEADPAGGRWRCTMAPPASEGEGR